MLVIFSFKTVKQGHELEQTYLYAYWSSIRGIISNYEYGMQRWPEKPLILGRSGTQFAAMVTKLLSSYSGAHLLEESYCKK